MPGWYWWRIEREDGFSDEIVQVHMMVWNEADGEAKPWCSWGWINQIDGHWAGPLPLPKEA